VLVEIYDKTEVIPNWFSGFTFWFLDEVPGKRWKRKLLRDVMTNNKESFNLTETAAFDTGSCHSFPEKLVYQSVLKVIGLTVKQCGAGNIPLAFPCQVTVG